MPVFGLEWFLSSEKCHFSFRQWLRNQLFWTLSAVSKGIHSFDAGAKKWLHIKRHFPSGALGLPSPLGCYSASKICPRSRSVKNLASRSQTFQFITEWESSSRIYWYRIWPMKSSRKHAQSIRLSKRMRIYSSFAKNSHCPSWWLTTVVGNLLLEISWILDIRLDRFCPAIHFNGRCQWLMEQWTDRNSLSRWKNGYDAVERGNLGLNARRWGKKVGRRRRETELAIWK